MWALVYRGLPFLQSCRSIPTPPRLSLGRLARLAVMLVVLAAPTALPVQSQESSAARTVQQILVQRGYDIGEVDGVWGPRSSTALKDLQTQLRLEPTGQPDTATLAALTRATSPDPGPVPPETVETPVVAPASPVAETVVETELLPPVEAASDTVVTTAPKASASPLPTTTGAGKHDSQTAIDFGPILIGLAVVTFFPAVGIYLFFRARDRRPLRQPSQGYEPEVEIVRRAPAELSPIDVDADADAVVEIVVRRSVNPPTRPTTSIPAAPRAPMPPAATPTSSTWVPAGRQVTVGKHRLSHGLVYVGEKLMPQSGWGDRDNCLIVPSMPVGAHADTSGQYLDYWPSYERLSPSSKKAYLDWLASDRSDPTTPVGYVFLYFYGLERRLMLERSAEDRDDIIAEVERLISIYGENRSFGRYSSDLLGAARFGEIDHQNDYGSLIGLGEIPVAHRLEMGRLAAAGQSIPARLLLSLATNHPESRLRAPVRRLPQLVAQRFAAMVERDHPQGLVVPLPRSMPVLEVAYRAASSTFEVPLIDARSSIPDLAQLTEPVGYARRLVETITNELDSYSREIGRANGAPTTIASLSKLPPELRHRQAAAVAATAIEQLTAIAASNQLYRLGDLLGFVGLDAEVSVKVGLRELSRCLGSWGLGVVPDPQFVPKILSDREGVLVFRLDMSKPAITEPSERYRLTYMALALGMVIAKADGIMSDDERRLLSRLVLETPDLADAERRRLVADFRWLESNPLAVSDLRKQLKDASLDFRKALMAQLITIAAADGQMTPEEVAILEKLAQVLALDRSSIYQGLHSAGTGDDAPMVMRPGAPSGPGIPRAPAARRTGVDSDRLAAIRAETAGASNILGEIFADDEDPAVEKPSATITAGDDGELDTRHRVLLEELATRPQWSREEFDRFLRQAGLMPGSVISKLNEWSLARCDELVLEGDDPIVINSAAILEDA
jgi:uncharacterized tellurite resistance protein B-like protein